MDEKLNIQNLIDALAEKHGMGKRNADDFVKEFFQLIEEALEKDRYVKVKGLGTFKLIEVESRESINVNTGERFQIQKHTKVSFTPETALKEVINKPFSHFETVPLLNDAIQDNTLQESEEDTAQEEIAEPAVAEAVASEPPVAEIVVPEPSVTETIVSEPSVIETVVPESAAPETIAPEPPVAETVAPEPSDADMPLPEPPVMIEDTPAVEPSVSEEMPASEPSDVVVAVEGDALVASPELPPADDEPATEKAEESSTMKFFIAIVAFIVLLCGAAVLFMYYPDLGNSLKKELAEAKAEMVGSKRNDAMAEAAETATAEVLTEADRTEVPEEKLPSAADRETVAPAEVAAKPEKTVPQPVATATRKETKVTPGKETKTIPKATGYVAATPFKPDSTGYTIVGTETTYVIQEGETLTKVAFRFYGTKALWPYIVKHNPDAIKNPNNVPSGTKVKIPKLAKKP